MIKLVNYVPNYICGNIITISDLMNDICNRYSDVKLYCALDKLYLHDNDGTYIQPGTVRYWQRITEIINRYMFIKKFDYFSLNCIDQDDIVISTMWQAATNTEWFNFSEIKGKVLILIDCLDIYTEYLADRLDSLVEKLSSNYKKVYLLANPINMSVYNKALKHYDNVEMYEYYAKLSTYRIDYFSSKAISGNTLLRTQILKPLYPENSYIYADHSKFINTLTYNRYAYCRHFMLENGLYIENIGKILFEYLYLGRDVDYYPTNKMIDDGMHYYLKQIEIDDNEARIGLRVNRDLLIDKLFINENDLIYQIINSNM